MSTKVAGHTPLPWNTEKLLGDAERIYAENPGPDADFTIGLVKDVDKETRRANAHYIVLSANYHERLVAALRLCAEWVNSHYVGSSPPACVREADSLLAEIEKAEGE